MTLRLYAKNTIIPKYKNGKWKWNNDTELIEFCEDKYSTERKYIINSAPPIKYGIQFKDNITEIDELLLRKEFCSNNTSCSNDFITIEDIKNIVFFTVTSNNDHIITNIFIDFFYTDCINQFLKYLIIYFDYFLKLIEFLLIRRDEIHPPSNLKMYGKMYDMHSVYLERMLAEYLTQHRLLLAREYSKILLGENDSKKFHHLSNKMKKSATEKDLLLFETFINFCTRIVWIAMHRKSYKIIDCEINRLFRSGHFNVAEKQFDNTMQFSFREQQVLFGRNDYRCNYRNQRSPLINELLNVSPENNDLLWIGCEKYQGTDRRLCRLELEYVTPESQLSLIGYHHGILGHPKSLYNTLLELDWHAVRKQNYTKDYDPYFLIRQPFLEIPNWNEFNINHKKNEPLFEIHNDKLNEKSMINQQKRLWKLKSQIIKSFIRNGGEVKNENIFTKCNKEWSTLTKPIQMDVDVNKIVELFLTEKKRSLKKKI